MLVVCILLYHISTYSLLNFWERILKLVTITVGNFVSMSVKHSYCGIQKHEFSENMQSALNFGNVVLFLSCQLLTAVIVQMTVFVWISNVCSNNIFLRFGVTKRFLLHDNCITSELSTHRQIFLHPITSMSYRNKWWRGQSVAFRYLNIYSLQSFKIRNKGHCF
jgi:hypothetical protein